MQQTIILIQNGMTRVVLCLSGRQCVRSNSLRTRLQFKPREVARASFKNMQNFGFVFLIIFSIFDTEIRGFQSVIINFQTFFRK